MFKKDIFNPLNAVQVMLFVMFVFALIALGICTEKMVRLANSNEEEVLCVVEDKAIERGFIGKVLTNRHYLYVVIEGDESEEKHKVLVTEEIFTDAEVGNHIKCIIYYDKNDIVDVQAWEP